MSDLRQQQRSKMRLARRNLPLSAQQSASHNILQIVNKEKLLTTKQNVAFYMAHDGEINPQLLFDSALAKNMNCYLPHITDDKELLFIKYKQEEELYKHHHGFLQPIVGDKNILCPSKLDVVFVPLVAFDQFCYRLGMGGGYYDKAFAFRISKTSRKPLLIGLAYAIQRVEKIRYESWDVQLDAVITEKKIYKK